MSDYRITDFEVGDVITYATWGNEIRRVFVEVKEQDIKNEQTGFAGYLVDYDNEKVVLNGSSLGVWGYCSQIVSIDRQNSNA